MTQATSRNSLLRSWVRAVGLAAALLSIGPAAASADAPVAEEGTTSAGVVNIQTASPEELQRLPGIGPSRAEAIVAQRDRRAFRRIEDLMRVRGVGRATFRRLRSMLTVRGATTLAPPPSRRARTTSSR